MLAVAVAAVPAGHGEFRLPARVSMAPGRPLGAGFQATGQSGGHQRVVAVAAPRVPTAAGRARTCSRELRSSSPGTYLPRGHRHGRPPSCCPREPRRIRATRFLSLLLLQPQRSLHHGASPPASHPLHPTPCIPTWWQPGTGGATARGDFGGVWGGLSSTRPPSLGCSIQVTPSLTPLTAPADAAPDADGL